MGLLASLIVGLIAGFLADKFIAGDKHSLVEDLILGVVGGFIGGFVFGLLGLEETNVIGSIISAFIGAAILIYVVRLIKK